MGISPQSVIKSVFDPFKYWDGYTHLGDPAYLKDSDSDFTEDFFVAVPSLSYRINDLITLNAGAIINIADQKGPNESVQFAVGITFNGSMGLYVDSDGDGVKDNRDKEPNTPKGYPVNIRGIALDTDGDGVPDGIDKQLITPKGAKVNQRGVALDSDSDGVYDGIDKEPNTPEGVTVDAYGVTIKKYSIHVSSYKNRSGAIREVENYRNKGYDSFMLFAQIPVMGNYYRVYVGRFKTELEAITEAQKLINLGYTKYAKVMKID